MSTKKKAKPANGAEKTPVIPAEEFVKAWQGCESLAEAVEKLGPRASARASAYRKKGVKLRAFAGGRAHLDVAALNEIIAEID